MLWTSFEQVIELDGFQLTFTNQLLNWNSSKFLETGPEDYQEMQEDTKIFEYYFWRIFLRLKALLIYQLTFITFIYLLLLCAAYVFFSSFKHNLVELPFINSH